MTSKATSRSFQRTHNRNPAMNAPVIVFPRIAKPVTPPLRHDGGFRFQFEDLGIEIEDGFGAGRFDGDAEVTYYLEDGQLEIVVGDITLRCTKWNGKQWEVCEVRLEREGCGIHAALYNAIWAELTEGSFKDQVEAAVEVHQ